MSNKEKKRQEYYAKKAAMAGKSYYKDFKPKYQRDYDEGYRKSSDSMHYRDSKSSSKYDHHRAGPPYHQSNYHDISSSKDHGHHSHLSRYGGHDMVDGGPP